MNIRLGVNYLEIYPEDLSNDSLQSLWDMFSRYLSTGINQTLTEIRDN